MPVTQTASTPATMNDAAFHDRTPVVRGPGRGSRHGRVTAARRRTPPAALAGTTRSMTMACVAGGCDEVELLGRERLDPLRRLQRVDSEAQAARDVFFRAALALQLLDLIAVAEQLEVLPRRDEQDQHEEAATPTHFHSSRCRASSTSRTMGLLRTSFLMAYLERFHQPILSAARSLALRARGRRSHFRRRWAPSVFRQHLH